MDFDSVVDFVVGSVADFAVGSAGLDSHWFVDSFYRTVRYIAGSAGLGLIVDYCYSAVSVAAAVVSVSGLNSFGLVLEDFRRTKLLRIPAALPRSWSFPGYALFLWILSSSRGLSPSLLHRCRIPDLWCR